MLQFRLDLAPLSIPIPETGMAEQTDLPSVLTHNALNEWLDHLLKLPPPQAAKKLLDALNQLKPLIQQGNGVLPRLIELIPLTLRLSNTLHRSVMSDTQAPDKSAKLSRLCLQLMRQLALIFAQAADHDKLNDGELQSGIYHALQLIGLSARYYALHYEAPSNSLWKKSAQLYTLAVSKGLLHNSVYTTIPEFKHQTTIVNVIKRNLLFSLCSPTLYTREEIVLHFDLAERQAAELDIQSEHQPGQFGFCWDLNGELPPGPIKFIRKTLPKGYLNIETQAIGRQLQEHEIETALSPMAQQKLALQLTGYVEIFDSILPGTPLRSELVLNYDKVCDFLKERNKLDKIQQLGTGMSPIMPKRKMSLVPLDHERNAFDTADTPYASTHQLARTVNIIKTPHQQFTIIQGRAFDCETGELALLFKDMEACTLAIIRRQKEHDISGSIHILLEKVNGNYSVYRYHTEQGVRHAILVEDTQSEVFLVPGKYSQNNRIILAAGISIRLTAFVESNAYFARFRFKFDD